MWPVANYEREGVLTREQLLLPRLDSILACRREGMYDAVDKHLGARLCGRDRGRSCRRGEGCTGS